MDQGLAELEQMARGTRRPETASPVREATKSGVIPPPVAQRPVAPPPPVAAVPAVEAPVPVPVSPVPAVPPPAPRPEPEAPVFDFGEMPSLPDLPEPEPISGSISEPVPELSPEPVLLAPELPPPAPVVPAPVPPPQPAAPVRVAEDVAATQRIPVFAGDETLDQPGERFGQYTLLEKIAAGGMAEVWKARMRGVEGFQKTVAIKKILPYMTDNSEFIGMFIDEAKLAAQLSHPNIVHIYDLGKIGRDYYIAMEYVEGRDLRSILNAAWRKRLWMPLGLGLLIGSRLASALDYAHRKRDFEGNELGLVHRDVSPQNVLISYEGDVKLCDFGIAKAVSKVGQTQMGALKGKLQYMSPEQAWGRPIDARSDIFSLGAVLFEMLTGERLFSGESEMSVLEAVRQGHVRHVRQVNPLIPTEVEAIVDRALASEPQNRFQSAGEMAQRIDEALHRLTPSPGPTDLAVWMRRALEPGEEAEAEPEVFPPSAAPPRFVPEPLPDAVPFPSPEPELAEAVAAVAPVGEVRVEEGGGRRSRVLLYAAIVVLILAVVLTLFVLNRPRPAPAPQTGPGPAAQAPTGSGAQLPAAGIPVAPTAPQASPGGVAPVDMQGLVNEELAKQNEALRRKYEEQQKKLEQQLAAKEGTPAPPAAEPRPAPQETPPPAAAVAPPPAVPEPTPAPVQAEPPRPAQRDPEPEPERSAPKEPEPEVRVRTGDLVAGGPGVKLPELVSAPKPQYPPQARQLRVEGVVVVSVLVDENGQVQDAKVIESTKEKVGFEAAAVAAARSARYRPATKDGTRVKMWTRLRIPFKL
jgi:TonB family protein